MKLQINDKYKIHSKRQLILLSSLAITIFFSMPRVALFRFTQINTQIDYEIADLVARTVYSFLFALFFFFLNMEMKKMKVLFLHIDLSKPYQLFIINLLLFIIIDLSLLRLHLYLFDPMIKERLFRFLFNITFGLELLMIILVSYIYRLIFYNQQIRMANEVLLKTNAETRYEVLKNQVNPHFLFNSFNTINSLILRDKNEAMNFVNNMSDVFRYVLESREMVTLEDELRILGAYIEMLKGRHGQKIMVEAAIDDKMLSYKLPPMALQILVENAVKHNVVSSKYPLHIRIFTSGDLIVSNDLKEKKIRERSTGLGLSNLNQRSRYLSNRDITIRRTEDEFIVMVPLIQ